jgi:hypothetical protein
MAIDMTDQAATSVEALQGIGDSSDGDGTTADSPADNAKRTNQAASSRDLSVATLMHLLGLPTMTQMGAMESSVDLMARKMQTISAQLEKISSELQALSADNSSERIDFQLNEIRALLKRTVLGASTAKPVVDPSAKSTRSARIIESEPPAEATGQKSEPDALAEFENAEDASFQAAEAQKVRDEMASKVKE